ncbi:MAG: arylsulfatase [Pirellulales bacterium]
MNFPLWSPLRYLPAWGNPRPAATASWYQVAILATAGLFLAAAAATVATEVSADETTTRRPNVIFILTDDQGYGDLSCHGNPILRTPQLDRLHAESVRFVDFQVSPTCSPTRSALLTGRHEFRNGITHTILERERLALDSITLPQVLQSAGYQTGIFGKWHLGDEDEYLPNRRGFSEIFIHGAGGIGQSYPGSCGDAPGNTYFDPAIWHNDKFVKTKGYCTDVFFAQATRWIDSVAGRQPFFCYIALNAPHAPLDVPPEYEQRYAGQVPRNAARFFGMIANIDDNVGRLLDHLRSAGLERDTLVIFMNDNGGTAGVPVFNAGMRGTKGTAWLGAIRASSFWRWPGQLTPADVPALAAHLDFFPTLAELTGATLDEAARRQIEGRSLVPLLKNPQAAWPDRTLFTHLGRWPKGANPQEFKYVQCSVRTTRWHLVSDAQRKSTLPATPTWQLFDLTADRGEQQDVAAAHPEVVRDLSQQYDTWWDSVQPRLVNEAAVGPEQNSFKVRYERQFGK